MPPVKYESGLDYERRVIGRLPGLRPSTKHQNIHQDIDAVSDNYTYSIKHQPKAAQTGRFAFEIRLFDCDQNWIPGSFATCEASGYIIGYGDSAYVFPTELLKEYISANKKDFRKVRLTQERIDDNVRQGRKYIDSLCYVIDVARLLHHVEHARVSLVDEQVNVSWEEV